MLVNFVYFGRGVGAAALGGEAAERRLFLEQRLEFLPGRVGEYVGEIALGEFHATGCLG